MELERANLKMEVGRERWLSGEGERRQEHRSA